MFQNYLKIAFRSIKSNKLYASLNIIGLASGITAALLIGLWVVDEISYDRYHQDYQDIALVERNRTYNGTINTETSNSLPLAAKIREMYSSDFAAVVTSSYGGERTLQFGESVAIRRGYFMEPGGQDILDLKMISGPVNFPLDPYSILLSDTAAKILFGKENPLEKVIRMDNKMNLKVAGIYQDLPRNSTFRNVHFYASMEAYALLESWVQEAKSLEEENAFPIYIKLAPHVQMATASGHIKNLAFHQENDPSNPELFLHPMSDWHLYPDFKNGEKAGNGMQFIVTFGFIGLFILLLAAINFMNLSTARAEKRAREIGVRKAIGSSRIQLVQQFYVETFLLVCIAGILGVWATHLALPWFNKLAHKNILFSIRNEVYWLPLLGFLLFTGLLAGSYPALYLSSFQPVKVLKGQFFAGAKAILSRKALVVFQFVVSITLTICALVMMLQLKYAKDRPMGYDAKGLVQLRKQSPLLTGHFFAMRDELKKSGAIMEMGESSGPITEFWFTGSGFEWKGKPTELKEDLITLHVTPEFGAAVNWEVVDGRDFSREHALDTSAIILNEAAVKLMGFQNPIDEMIRYENKNYLVIGVTKDIVMDSPYEPVKPTVFRMRMANLPFITFRLNPEKSASGSMEKVNEVLKQFDPNGNFNFKFIDAQFDLKFWREERATNLAVRFSIMAVFISLLGIFGLASFMAEQRSKEIGVRKVLGASVAGITGLLAKDFLKLVLLAIIIATPIAQYFMQGWLSDFPYHVAMHWWMFAGIGLAAIIVAFLTVGGQAVKAALANPVKSLRRE